jgi:trimeric autotransporter adhesin
MVRIRKNLGYGLQNALQNLSPEPIAAQRDPGIKDFAQLGTIWSNQATLDVFILAAFVGGVPQWLNVAGGAGVFDSVTATLGNITANLGDIVASAGDIIATLGDITAVAGTISGLVGNFTGITVTANGINSTGPLTIAALGAGVVQTDATGLVFSDNGADGQVLIGAGAGAPAWANITSPLGSIAVGNGANSITLETAGAAGTSELDADVGTAAPVAGVVQLLGGSNCSTTAAVDTVTIDLDASISVAGSITGGTGLTATTGDLVITAGNISLPTTTATAGIWVVNGNRWMHSYGTDNTFVGNLAGNFTLTGTNNVCMGTQCGLGLTTGSYNTGIGQGNTLIACTTGTGNTAIGSEVMVHLVDGNDNTGIGRRSLTAVTSGDDNCCIGRDSGVHITTGDGNICIGSSAGTTYTTESDNIVISNAGTAADAGVIRIGTAGTQLKCFISGITGVTTAGAAVAVLVDGSGQLGTISSSLRYKENIQDMEDFSDPVMDLQPRTFEFKKRPGVLAWGLIAEEVEKIFPWIVNYDEEGRPDAVRYHDLPALLLDQLQKMKKRVEELQHKAAQCSCN